MSPQSSTLFDHSNQKLSGEEKSPPDEGREQSIKRRTKTGCLTCRKRRIKCGEERPVCKNCVKSKRECAGYSHPAYQKKPVHVGLDMASDTAPNFERGWSWQGSNFEPLDYSRNTQQLQHHQSATSSFSGKITADNNQATQAPSAAGSMYSNLHQLAFVPDTSLDSADQMPLDATVVGQQYSVPHPAIDHETNLEWVSDQTAAWRLANNQMSSGWSSSHYNNLGFAQHPGLAQSTSFADVGPVSTRGLDEAEDLEDLFDVKTMHVGTQNHSDVLPSGSISYVQTRRRASRPSQVLVSKNDLIASSPLLEEKSQEIFRHFISITGPCMSTFERRESVPNSTLQKVVWTSELPMMASRNAALAHAVLALSAMHMSKLGLCSEGVALKHFTYACRRVGKSIGKSNIRLEVPTLATVLLLGYYEVMRGDHSCWRLHLGGAAKLVMEHNYAVIMKSIRYARTQVNKGLIQGCESFEAENAADKALPTLLDDDCWNVNEESISKLMGIKVEYDIQTQTNFGPDEICPLLDQRRIKNWMTLMEFYWWYCKQDVFQSMLSGEPLLLPYSEWKYCPPRGLINNIQRPHATMDHLWLILARLTDFGAKDRKRKQKVVEAQGGHWIPAPGFMEPSPSQVSQSNSARPSANEGRVRKVKQTAQHPPPQQPAFFGMIPPPATEPRIKPSFATMNAQLRRPDSESSQESSHPSDTTLEQQTQNALAEHDEITKSFEFFESCLGTDFQPLSADDIQITTPFGSAIRYKSPTVASMWTFFLIGKIVLRRAHPHSPPAAMMSAGVNMAFTKDYAQLVGRICGGLFAQHNYLLQAGHVGHLLSAAVMEVTFSLLFAAIQFQDPIQRGWTIGKLSEIARVTGWQSSAAVAAACETTWEAMGCSGRGPPYERTLDQNNSDARVNGRYRYVYGLSPEPTTPVSQAADNESRFVSHDRDLIDRQAGTRVHWALGLLSVEGDLKRMAVSERG